MANERSKDKSHEVVEKLGIGFNKLNNKFVNLLEENQKIKQQYKNHEEKIQEILRTNSELNKKNKEFLCTISELNEKHREILRTNSNLIEENKEFSRINSELKSQLHEKDIQFEKLQQHTSNLEKQRNEESQQIQQLEMMKETLEKNLEVLKLDEIDENIIKALKENNKNFSSNFFNKGLEKDTEKPELYSDIRVVVGLDFGVKYSGFAYSYVTDQDICSNDKWHDEVGKLKTNTVLQYDDEYNNVLLWGAPALAEKPNRRTKSQNNKRNNPVELFALYLSSLDEGFKPKLPVDYKKAITDYLGEIGKVIKVTVAMRWPRVDYFKNTLLVITVPAEFSEKSKIIMRTCAYNASLIKEEYSTNLQIITEPEASVMYCMKNRENQVFAQSNTNIMIVDCGDDVVNLTTHNFINNHFGEITNKAKDSCGSSFINAEFIKYLRKRLGDKPMNLLRDNNYGQMQYLIQQFCNNCKIPFTGDDPDFIYELDIERTTPVLLQYITNGKIKNTLEEDDWIIEIDFKTIKSIFDPVIQKILHLIKAQLNNTHETCSAMFLVGSLSESKYLQKRIKEEFNHQVNNISVPAQPIAAVSRGAVIYGLESINSNGTNNLENKDSIIPSRVLKFTYGIGLCLDWKEGVDPPSRKISNGKVFKFSPLVRRGTVVEVDQVFSSSNHRPSLPDQIAMNFKLYRTSEYNAEYCDEPGMELLGELYIDLPDVHLGCDRVVTLGLSFDQTVISVFAIYEVTGKKYIIKLLCSEY
ncbi:hypothetical protein RhiirA5_501387 [Rhizophagus irregularis]|uniref:Hsp70 family protein n=1 Tax=Rhizophagus irregularis TaxID=588596 RepID=A0A2I1FD49_9GLOM|nr:hypothetical protein RhiirA5_501387 [Rhizophagus irregularis]PKC59979.1 hypothetical protein RhiirA1_491654 [Rhizophagus irregularis]PKY32309.1 hypothetical protein RhiirB3_532006 [Rhizophagus irregularis]CAB5125910.1 unnamed protein product [Rhizophagus irregularis]